MRATVALMLLLNTLTVGASPLGAPGLPAPAAALVEAAEPPMPLDLPPGAPDGMLQAWGAALGIPSLAASDVPVPSGSLGAPFPPSSLPALYLRLASSAEQPLAHALERWASVLGTSVPDHDLLALGRDAQVPIAALLYALADATELQQQSVAALSEQERADLLALPHLLASAPIDDVSDPRLQAVARAASKLDMGGIQAASQIVSGTVSQVLPSLEAWAETRRAAEQAAAARQADLLDLFGTSSTRDGLDSLIDLCAVLAGWAGADGEFPAPSSSLAAGGSLDDIVFESLGRPADAVGALADGSDAPSSLPPGVQRALGRVVLGYAGWLDAMDHAGSSRPASQAAAVVPALMHLLAAVRDAAPVLEAYGLYVSHSGAAMMPKDPREAAAAPAAFDLAARALAASQDPVADTAATIAWSHGGIVKDRSARAPPPGGLEPLILALYESRGVSVDDAQRDAMRRALKNLGPSVETAAARVLAAQLDGERRIAAAWAGPEDEAALAVLQDPAIVDRVGRGERLSPSELEQVRRGFAAMDRIQAALDEAAALMAVELDLIAADPPALPDHKADAKPWYRKLLGMILRMPRFGHAAEPFPADAIPSACVPLPSVTDCDNDIWFMDPALQTVIVSGPGTTSYDPTRVGRSVSPSTGTTSAEVSSRQMLTLDLGGEDVYSNNAGGAWFAGTIVVPTAGPIDSSATAIAIDLDGHDSYVKPPMSYARYGIQGAGIGGVGILFDLQGNDVYLAEEGAQGFGGGPVPRPGVSCPTPGHGPECLRGFAGIGLLIDGQGDDIYTAASLAQGAVARADTASDAALAPLGPVVGGAGALLDLGGSDRYLLNKAGPRVGQAGGATGVALLLDAEGNDAYHGGSQGTSAGGLAALVDAGGSDRYSRVHPLLARQLGDGDCWTNIQGTDGPVRMPDPTRPRDTPFFDEATGWLDGAEVFVDTTAGTPCAPLTGPLFPAPPDVVGLVADPDGDRDRDGWPDSLETLLGDGWDPDDKNDHPAGVPTLPIDNWPPTLPDGRTLPAGSGFVVRIPGLLVVGDVVTTVYPSEHDAAITIDLGGADDYFDAAGSAFRLSVDVGSGNDRYVHPRDAQGSNGILLNLGGDDLYWSQGASQGVASGGGFAPAVGILFDADGSDRYVVDGAGTASQGSVADLADVSPTGGGGEAFALALLVDNGTHTDFYEAPARGVVAVGSGSSSDVALFADAGGDDRYTRLGLQGTVAASSFGGWGTLVQNYPPSIGAFLDAAGTDSYRGTRTNALLPDTSAALNDRVRISQVGRPAAPLPAGGSSGLPGVGLFIDQDRTSAKQSLEPEPLLDLPAIGLHVGSSGPDTYLVDYSLLIDQGGDDAYLNNAGGSLLRALDVATTPGTAEAEIQARGLQPLAAVLIDLGTGADRYNAADRLVAVPAVPVALPHQLLPAQTAGLLTQGAGFLGVGILVDSGGDDAYTARSLSQGTGLFGSGILWDRDGNDRYGFDAALIGNPVMDAGLVVWPEFDHNTWTLQGRFPGGNLFSVLPAGVEGPIRDPVIYDGRVAFSAFNAETLNWDVYVVRPVLGAGGGVNLADFFLASNDPTAPARGDPANQVAPALGETRIVWQDDRSGVPKLYTRPADNNQFTPVPFSPGPASARQERPATDGKTLVWQDSRERGGQWSVFLSPIEDPTTTVRVSPNTPSTADHVNPRVSESFVVWQTRASPSDDWDLAVYNRKSTVEPLRVLERPGDQIEPDTVGGVILVSEPAADGRPGTILRYDWEENAFTLLGTDRASPAIDRSDAFDYAWIQAPPPAVLPDHVANPYGSVLRGSLMSPDLFLLSSAQDSFRSTLLQGSAWSAGLGLLMDDAGIDSYFADEAAQGFAFTTGRPTSQFLPTTPVEDEDPEDDPSAQDTNAGEPLVQAILLDMEGNDLYRARASAQGAHIGAPIGILVRQPNPPTSGDPIDYVEFAQDLGLLMDLRGNDAYWANRESQGISQLVLGTTLVSEAPPDDGGTPGPPPPNTDPQPHLDASVGIFADLGHQDFYAYNLQSPATPHPSLPCSNLLTTARNVGGAVVPGEVFDSLDKVCGSFDGGAVQPPDSNDREDTSWRQSTKTDQPLEPALILNEGGKGVDLRLFDALDPEMAAAGREQFAVALEVPPTPDARLSDAVTVRAEVTRGGTFPEVLGVPFEVRRVDFFIDAKLVGSVRPVGGCANGCTVPFAWDTRAVVDGAYQLVAKVQLGLPSGGSPIAFVQDATSVIVDNAPVILGFTHSTRDFSPFPYDRDASPHATVTFTLPPDGDSPQLGFATVYVTRGPTLVRTVLPWTAIQPQPFTTPSCAMTTALTCTWNGLDENNRVVTTGAYQIHVEASDRAGHPAERTVSASVPVNVDSLGPVGTCFWLKVVQPCNGQFYINQRSGVHDPLTGEMNVALRIKTSDDGALADPLHHVYAINTTTNAIAPLAGTVFGITAQASGDQVDLTFLHNQTVRLVGLTQDDVGNLECAPGCGQRTAPSISPDDATYRQNIANSKAAVAESGGVPTVAEFVVDLHGPSLLAPTIRYVVDGRPVPLDSLQRVGTQTPMSITLQATDHSGGPLLAEFIWSSFERNPPLEYHETVAGVPVPGQENVFAFSWDNWDLVPASWPADVQGSVLLNLLVHDVAGNTATELSTTVLLDRGAPDIVDAQIEYPKADARRASVGDDVDIVADVVDAPIAGLSASKASLTVTVDATAVTSKEGAEALRLAYRPATDRFVLEDLKVEPDLAPEDATTYFLPLRAVDSVGNVRSEPTLLSIVVGDPKLFPEIEVTEPGVFAYSLTWSTANAAHLQLRYLDADGVLVVVEAIEDPTRRLHHFELDDLLPDAIYPYSILAIDDDSGARELLVGLSLRTALGLQVSIDEPASGATLAGIARVDVHASSIGKPADQPRVSLSLERIGSSAPPRVLLDQLTDSNTVSLDLVTDALEPGLYRLTARASLGPEVAEDVADQLSIDNMAPELSFLTPAEATLLAGTPSALRLRVADAVSAIDVQTLRVRLDGQELADVDVQFLPSAGLREGVLVVTGIPTLPPGTFRFAASVEDIVGNVASTSVRFLVDPDSPQGTLRIVAEGGQAVRPGQTIRLIANVHDDTGIREVRLRALDRIVPEDLTLSRVGGAWGVDLRVAEDAPAGRFVLNVNVVDLLGNERMLQLPILVDPLPLELVGWQAVAADSTRALFAFEANKPFQLDLKVASPSGEVVVERAGNADDAFGVLPGDRVREAAVARDLEPGVIYHVVAVLRDAAGRKQTVEADWLFAPTSGAPPSLSPLAPRLGLGGVLDLAWSLLGNDSAVPGIWYNVYRSEGGIFDPIARTAGLGWRDGNLTPGAAYRYFVVAENLAGERGPPSSITEVRVPLKPSLSDVRVTPSMGTGATVFRFQATVHSMASAQPSAWLHVDGRLYMMHMEPVTGDCRASCVLVAETLLPTLDLRTPIHRYHVEVFDGASSLRLPASGELEGPTVVEAPAQKSAAGDGGKGSFGTAPASGLLGTLVSLLLIAAVGRRRNRRDD